MQQDLRDMIRRRKRSVGGKRVRKTLLIDAYIIQGVEESERL
jgi:hypothetical protein